MTLRFAKQVVADVVEAIAPTFKNIILAIVSVERLAKPLTTDKEGNSLSNPLTHVISVKGDSKILGLLGLDKGRVFVPQNTINNFMQKAGLLHEDELRIYLANNSLQMRLVVQETEFGKKYVDEKSGAEWVAGEAAEEGKYKDGDVLRRISQRVIELTKTGEKIAAEETAMAIRAARTQMYLSGMNKTDAPAPVAPVAAPSAEEASNIPV